MKARRTSIAIAAVAGALLAFGVAEAVAGLPHFKSADAVIVEGSSASARTLAASSQAESSGPALLVSFVEVGLGSTSSVEYSATADASATYACINGGGRNPSATNKRTITGSVQAAGSFVSDRNGRVSGSMTTSSAPGPGDFACPRGQELVLATVTFSNIVLTDVTNGVQIAIDPVSKTYVSL